MHVPLLLPGLTPSFRPLLIAALLLAACAPNATRGVAADCEFRLGFRALHDQIPSIVGDCLENEHFNPATGNTEQRTSGGLVVWRQADNWTAFTDGATTWIAGPNGLESRPNNERFAWEMPSGSGTTPDRGPTIPAGAEPLVKLTVADAAQRTGLDPAAIRVLKVEPRQWPDASLGCPRPKALYAQVLTPGVRDHPTGRCSAARLPHRQRSAG